MDLSHIKAIIFDAEGVVVDTEILWDKSQDVLLGRRALEYDREYLKPRMAGQTLLEGAELMVDYYQLDEKPAAIEKERKELIHDLFENDKRVLMFIDILLLIIAASCYLRTPGFRSARSPTMAAGSHWINRAPAQTQIYS